MTAVRAAGVTAPTRPDPFDATFARRAPGLLRAFNAAGVLTAPDVHVALRLGELGGEESDEVRLAAALAVRATRLGHVCTDLATVRRTVTVDAEAPVDLDLLAWPDPAGWIPRLIASPLVGTGSAGTDDRPLRLSGSRLYLDRYWRDESAVAADLRTRSATDPPVDLDLLAAGLDRLFDGPAPDFQRLAAAVAVLRRVTVIAGGPGTGKTTTVARAVALLDEQALAAGQPLPLVALVAPTGKAAVRLGQAVRDGVLGLETDQPVRDHLLGLRASTLHRLLGRRPGYETRFGHHRGNRLPHDVVIVDESSMVSLSLMARLVEALRADARLVLVGDPEQLASVEAGAVLGDIVGRASAGLVMRPPAQALLARVAGQAVPATSAPAAAAIGDGIVLLRTVHRFGGRIAALAGTIRAGDAAGAVATLRAGQPDVQWVELDVAAATGGKVPAAALEPVRAGVIEAERRVTEAARAGDAAAAIDALSGFRLLCAHRHGPYGVSTWAAEAEGWLRIGAEGDGPRPVIGWYVGQPLLVTENDYALGIFNGDLGVIVASGPGRLRAVFAPAGQLIELSPTRLTAVDTVHAMTVHKSQGSQFDAVAVVLPEPASPILTRELLYTAVTRARRRLVLVATEPAVRSAIDRPIARASGLEARLWASGESATDRPPRTGSPALRPSAPSRGLTGAPGTGTAPGP